MKHQATFFGFLMIFFLGMGELLTAQCVAGFTFEDDGLTISFTDASQGNGSPVVVWAWDFDDGGTSTQQNPTHTFAVPDKYKVCLTITTQNGCSDEYCFDVEICTLIIQATVGSTCDPDGNIVVDVTISDPYDAAVSINVFLDGVLVNGSPFDIDDVAPVMLILTIPGDGLTHSLSVQSEQIGHCNAVLDFTVPDCGSNCFLSGLNIQFAGGTTHEVQVGNNFFSPASITVNAGDQVHWTWVGDGHSSTSDATSGADSWNSGVLAQGAMYTRTIYNPGLHRYYCIPHGGPGGAGMSGSIVANCPPGNQFVLNISFNADIAGPQGFNLLLDGIIQPGSPFPYSGTGPNMTTLDLPGDGMQHQVAIQDVADPTCILEGTVTGPNCGAAPTCMLGVQAMVISGCDPSNLVEVQLTVTEINGGNAFNILIDGIPAGQVSYDPSGTTVTTIPVNGDGTSHTIQVVDANDQNCSATTSVATPNCTIQCMFSNLMLSTGAQATHVVEVQDFQFSPQHVTITSGDVVRFEWTGAVQHTSTSDAASGPDSWDSGLQGPGSTFTTQMLSEGVHPYYCIPHGGPGGIGMSGTITVQADCTNGDVSVNVQFDATGGGFNGFNILVDQNVAPEGPFPYDPSGHNQVSVLVPGDGLSHQITVKDIDDPACALSASLMTPDCNPTLCMLGIAASLQAGCDSSQMVTVQVTVTGINGGANGFQLLIDGVVAQGSPFGYDSSGTTVINVLIPGDGAQHIISAEDLDDPGCTAGTNLLVPDCSIPCQIFGLEILPDTPTVQIVEVRDFEFIPKDATIALGDTVRFVWTGSVAHTSTSDTTAGPDSWDSGLLTEGSYDVMLSTPGLHRYYCIPHGGPGGIGMSGTLTALEDCDNGLVPVTIGFMQNGGSFNGYYVLIDQDTLNPLPFPYDTGNLTEQLVLLPGDGMLHEITIGDAADSTCQASVFLETPDCSAPPCMLSIQAEVSGGCNQAGRVPVAVTVSDISGSLQGFNLLLDGIPQAGSPFAYDSSGVTVITILVPGDLAAHTIFVHDIGNVSCAAQTEVVTPDCAASCALSGLSILYGEPAGHLVEVRDFAFFPMHLNITLGDTVHFVWTGQVAHTSTSDATQGPDVWESGLLGNGATFDLVLSTPGVHPYYCIPHGAPGGIGMAGTITVQEVCTNDSLRARLCFNASNGSFEGYEIQVDTMTFGPFQYAGSGYQCANIDIPGDGLGHALTLADIGSPECVLDTTLVFPDCQDPCFGFKAGFTFTYNPQSLIVQFNNTSSADAVSFLWDFGDGSESNMIHPEHQYLDPQDYQVCLIATSAQGCQDTICLTVPLAAFVCEPGFRIMINGLTVTLTDTSRTSAAVSGRIWSLGDGTIVQGQPVVVYTYADLGIYDICLSIAADSCMQTICRTVDLSDQCLITQAAFSYSVDGSTVSFSDHSTGEITSRLWGFGDGGTSTLANPAHSYHQSGVYVACLLIFDSNHNCSSYTCADVHVGTTAVSQPAAIRPLLLFPNPVAGESPQFSLIGLMGQDLGKQGRLTLYTIQGQVMMEWQGPCEEKLDITPPSLAPGMYLVTLRTSGHQYSGKLIVR